MLLGRLVEKFMDSPMNPSVNNLLRKLVGRECWDESLGIATGRFFRPEASAIPGFFNLLEIAALQESGFIDIEENQPIVRHWRVSIDGVKYQSQTDRVTKYNNSIAHVPAFYDGEEFHFIDILSIVTWHHTLL